MDGYPSPAPLHASFHNDGWWSDPHSLERLWHSESLISPSKLGFDTLWRSFLPWNPLPNLLEEIRARKAELAAQKEWWRHFIATHLRSREELLWRDEVAELLTTGSISRCSQGASGVYLLADREGVPRYIIKPEESPMTLHNPHCHGCPLVGTLFRARPSIPPYETPQTEYLAYRTAELLGLAHITPATTLMILEHAELFDVADELLEDEIIVFTAETGPIDKEKLCAVQRYLPDTSDMHAQLQQWLDNGTPEETITPWIYQDDVEAAALLAWVIFDTDAHASNFLFRYDPLLCQYRIHKIDHALSFPTQNLQLINFVAYLPNAAQPLSETMRHRIATIPVEQIEEVLHVLNMPNRIGALRERVQHLQAIVAQTPPDELSITAIDQALQKLGGSFSSWSFL